MNAHRAQRGASAIEFAIAAPIVLLLGLGALQWALVFHARQAIEHAAIEAARSGSMGHALPDAIETGLARGLLLATAAARVRLQQARAAGWVVIRRVAPTLESFADWAEPALDDWGRPIMGLLEIPNDNLHYAEQRAPAGGASGTHLGLPVGRQSGQTLLDANLLKIEIVYGVPMTVPLIGRIAALAGRALGGCLAAERGGCAIFQAPDPSGRAVPRWPVSTSATIRMQSPARQTADTPTRASLAAVGIAANTPPTAPASAPGAAPVNPGTSSDPSAFRPPPGPPGASYGGVGAYSDGSLVRPADGWLSLGGDRVFSVPGACVAN